MNADGARLLGDPDDRVLDLARRDHHQVGELVDHAEDVRQRRLPVRDPVAVERDEVAGARGAHDAVALLHLLDEVAEHVRGQPRAGHDRRQEMRDLLVVVQLDPLRVDQHHPDLVRGRAQQDRGEHRVDGAGLAGAGRARDEHVRLLREVGPDRLARDVLAEPDRQRRVALRRIAQDVPEVDHAPDPVRDLDADRLLARDRRENPDVLGGERVGEVVAELGDLRHLDPGRQPQLVARHVRARDRADHLRLDVEVRERLDELDAALLDRL
jgi:hypothetical protein